VLFDHPLNPPGQRFAEAGLEIDAIPRLRPAIEKPTTTFIAALSKA
jgi:hypothetical protein